MYEKSSNKLWKSTRSFPLQRKSEKRRNSNKRIIRRHQMISLLRSSRRQPSPRNSSCSMASPRVPEERRPKALTADSLRRRHYESPLTSLSWRLLPGSLLQLTIGTSNVNLSSPGLRDSVLSLKRTGMKTGRTTSIDDMKVRCRVSIAEMRELAGNHQM